MFAKLKKKRMKEERILNKRKKMSTRKEKANKQK